MIEQVSSKQVQKDSLDRLRRRLLDLSRRNPLLNYRFPKRRSIKIIDELPSETFYSLLTGRRFTLTAIEESQDPSTRALVPTQKGQLATAEDQSLSTHIAQELPKPGEVIDAKHLDDLLQTPFDPKELEGRGKVLHTAARTALEETGTNFLHLAIGFLEWFESDDSAEKSRAPLILVPLEINKGKHDPWTDTFQYSINYSEEDIETNLSLAEKLAQDFRIELPEFDAECNPEDYLAEVSENILSYPRWRVVREMVIGLFSFSKLLMYRELNQNHGPEAQHPIEHPIVSRLLGSAEAHSDNHTDLQLAEIYNIDRSEQAHEIQLVMDADSSQHSALIDALVKGKNLVIHGPPGTGKSQTITNLIAAALANGKSILFVAEKSAALEVVKHRLDWCGLGDFVLQLHALGTNKGQLHRDLERRLHQHFPEPRNIKEEEVKLTQERLRLLSYTEAAQLPIGPDQEPFFKVAFRASRFRTLAKPDFSEPTQENFPLLSRSEIEERATLIHEAAELWQGFPETVRQAWGGIDLRKAFGVDLQRIPHLLSSLRTAAVETQRDLAPFFGEVASTSRSMSQLYAIITLQEVLNSSAPPHVSSALWPHLLSDSTAEQIRELHLSLSQIPTLTEASSVLPQTSDCLDREFVSHLQTTCARLTDQRAHDKTLNQLDALQQNAARCVQSTEQLLSCIEAVQDVLGTAPSYLHDFEKVLSLADLIEKPPQLVEQAFELGWLRPDTMRQLQHAEAKSQKLELRLREVQKKFDTEFAPEPQKLRLIAKRLRIIHTQWFGRLRGEYRALRKELIPVLRNPKEVQDHTLAGRFEALAGLLDEVRQFAEDTNMKAALGTAFKGVDTNWSALRSAVSWAETFTQTIGDSFRSQDLLINREATATKVSRLRSQLSQSVFVLRERLRECGLGEHCESPIALLRQLLEEQTRLLEETLPTLRRAQVPRPTTVEQIDVATTARRQLLTIHQELDAMQGLPAVLGSHWRGPDTDTTVLTQALDWLARIRTIGVEPALISWFVAGQMD